jgi:TfoX/Sxy family transcriptional regulator of competence genes
MGYDYFNRRSEEIMAYNLDLAQQIKEIMAGRTGISEKKMFGGVGFMLHGNMICGVNKEDLIVRVGLDQYDQCLKMPHTHVFDMTGRPMRGWVTVSPKGYETTEDLVNWVEKGISFVKSLPPK